ncbi:MAG: GH92 family glycosyl hydrolase [Bacteroidales bacterium]|nr:GH92 family glycosyl hydrolase [Bacteroidales bacterium]
MRRCVVLFLAGTLISSVSGCFGQRLVRLTDFVDPFIGTGGHGHTYPGATWPFGMVQVSPDTRLEGWDGCSAYHASDDTIYGFSHTHLSGTGCSDYGDILLMPVTGEVSLSDYNYASSFDRTSEKASPGYYRVSLSKYDIGVELTAAKRSGFHRYTYPASETPAVVLDLQHRDKVIESGLKIVGDREVEGYRFSTEWAKDQRLFFVIRFSKPFRAVEIENEGDRNVGLTEAEGVDIKALFLFKPTKAYGEIQVKIGISAVSIDGARNNLDEEVPGWEFDEVLDACRLAWTKELEKITVGGGAFDDQKIFYTALYHAMLSPNLYMDVDGRYLGRDLQVHQADSFDYYTVFSLWDTYRALHPLLTIIDQKRTNDFIRTFLRQYQEGGLLPVWELSANETNCMIGYHAIPVIADAYQKGIRDYDADLALEAMKNSANQDQFGLKFYRNQGFIPGDQEGESVSKTLEYAYDDWCIALMAYEMKKEDDYKEFIQRAQYYKNIFDPTSGFMRAKLNNQWFTPFDPYEVNFNYTEANAWQYSFCVAQDIDGLIGLMGGKEAMAGKLDELFSAKTETTGRDQADITGLIGQYAHGNEPSHHMAYLYDYVGQPWKTQELVHRIMNDFYTNQRDGLCGNEDCGQMSAWYVFSALGFYPVTPGSGFYAIGTPRFPSAKIELENGNTFTITANNLSEKNFYIQSCTLNGIDHPTSAIRHQEIMEGGELVFEMGSSPNYDWGTVSNYELRITNDELIQPVPYVAEGDATFFYSTTIALSSPDPTAKIYYSLNQNPASGIQNLYTGPITLHETTTLCAFAQKEGSEPSFIIESTFQKIPENRKIKLNTQYAPQYSAGGDFALIDFKKGGENFKTGVWQGYEGVDLDAVVDLGEIQQVRKISAGFLQDAGSWIFFPTEVEFFTSLDGEHFSPAGISIHEFSQKDFTPTILEQWADLEPSVEARYVRVVAKTPGICPDWHPGAGKKCWIFVDEITVLSDTAGSTGNED